MYHLQSTTSTMSSVEGGRREFERLSLAEKQRSTCDSQSSLKNSEKRRAKEMKSSREGRSSSKHKLQQTDQALAAQTAARYYSECYMQGVGSEDANQAAAAVKENYQKYWLQKFDNEKTTTPYEDDNYLQSSPTSNLSPPEHTSSLVEEEGCVSCKEALESTDFYDNVKNTSALHRGVPSLPNSEYFTVTDTDDNLIQLGGTENAIALVPGNEEQSKTRTNFNTTTNITTPPVKYVCMHNEKKRDYKDFTQHEPFVPQKISGTRKNDGKEVTKQTQLGHEQDINYKKATSFEKYMNKAKDFVHKVSDSNVRESFTNYPSKNIEAGSDFSFQQLDEKLSAIITSRSPLRERRAKHTENAKLSLVHALAVSGGDVKSKEFLFALDQLRSLFLGSSLDARVTHDTANKSIEGTWLCLSRPHFKECLGENSAGEYMYTMGRMSFDMFAPTNLVCSIQCVFNTIEQVDVGSVSKVLSIPRNLREEVYSGRSTLRTYNIVTAFTIEPDSPTFDDYSPNKPIHKALQGLFTVQGYILPDPEVPNRLSIWFSGGEVVPNDTTNDRDFEEWMRVFEGGSWKRHLYEKARLLAARILLGAEIPECMDSDGSMRFKLNRPIGGHGTAYVDVLYLDETLRVVRGHHGSLFVFSRVSS